MNFFYKALEYIFLPCCGVCGKIGEEYLCAKCGKELEKYYITGDNIDSNNTDKGIDKGIDNSIKNIEHSLVDSSIKNVDIIHIFKYREIIRKLILQYKFNDKAYLYNTFCKIIVKNKKIFDFIKSYDIIIPVPIHKKRMKERGYNQSELISKKLANILDLKIYRNVLIKIKDNKPQSTLTQKEREENTKNVYKLTNSEKICNKKVLIFDDVYTTGATINACIKEIEKARPSKIGVLTLAKN